MNNIDWRKELIDQIAHIGVGLFLGATLILLGVPGWLSVAAVGMAAFIREMTQRDMDLPRTLRSKKAWFETGMFQVGALLACLIM